MEKTNTPMDRAPLLRLLDDYAESRPDEAAVASRIRALVAEHEDCFLRSCRPGHITGSAWVVSHDGRKHLLLHHRKLGKWLQPGGHADGDPDVAAVALKEAREESGLASLRLLDTAPLDIDVHLIPERLDADGRLMDDAHEHHDLRFLITAERDEQPAVSDESHAVRWCDADEVRRLTSEPSVLRLLEKATDRLAARRGDR